MKLDFGSLENLYYNFLEILPEILTTILLIIIGYVLYKVAIWAVNKLLKAVKAEKLNPLINNNELLKGSSLEIDVRKIILTTVKFILILVFLVLGADMLNLSMVSVLVGNLIEYLPKFFVAVLIFVVGTYLASQAKKLIQNLLKSIDANGSKALANIVFYLIFIFVSITALNQAGVNTEIISNNVSFILAAILVTLTLAVGLGSRDIVYRLILGFYTKRNLEIGMKVKIGDETGVIESIDNICLVLKTQDETIIFPIKKINNQEVRILD